MAYFLSGELDKAKVILVKPVADKAKGLVEVVNGVRGFWFSGVNANELGTLVINGTLFDVDADNTLAYSAGEAVYDDGVAPTGTVNKTSGGTRTIVGYAYRDYPIGTARITIVPKDLS
jgi:hypothetical protein